MSNQKYTTKAKQPDAAIDTARLLGVRATESDLIALRKLQATFKPDEEFTHWKAYGIRRAEYRLNRLAKQGYLKVRVTVPDGGYFRGCWMETLYSLA